MSAMSSVPSLGPRGEGWVALQVILLVIIVAAGWTLGPDWSGVARFVGILVGIAGIAGGLLLIVRGSTELGRALTPFPRPKADTGLVTTGVYALARHPIYGGLILASIGGSLLQASVVALGASALLVGVLWLKSVREEAWLSDRFPDYAAYRRRTKRFIPWIG
jgi:protein-S-isoprenylcysteine O-methyltransferase Ste14